MEEVHFDKNPFIETSSDNHGFQAFSTKNGYKGENLKNVIEIRPDSTKTGRYALHLE